MCGGSGHLFNDCLELNSKYFKLREAYLKLQLAANHFCKAIDNIDQLYGNKYKGNMNVLRTCSLNQLTTLQDVPQQVLLSLLPSDAGYFNNIETHLNTVTEAVSKTTNIVSDLHWVMIFQRLNADNYNNTSFLQSLSSLNDFLLQESDFRQAFCLRI